MPGTATSSPEVVSRSRTNCVRVGAGRTSREVSRIRTGLQHGNREPEALGTTFVEELLVVRVGPVVVPLLPSRAASPLGGGNGGPARHSTRRPLGTGIGRWRSSVPEGT